MGVHHTKIKQAMQIGCHLSESTNHRYRIFWPQRSVELFGHTIDEALDEMRATQSILHFNPDYKVITNHSDTTVTLMNRITGKIMKQTPAQPTEIWAIIEAEEDQWVVPLNEPLQEDEMSDRINGVHINGAVAFKEGVPAADCPYIDESDDFSRWNNEWDEAADQAENPPPKGSVVTNRYRATYSEYGHPTHCGDELAILLNNLCLNKAGINLELFEAICAANGVNLTRYNRTTKGWQGRLRMTGRNLLAKRLKSTGGKLIMPPNMTPDSYTLSYDWMVQAEQKYKPKV
jgi:hypothetical protein